MKKQYTQQDFINIINELCDKNDYDYTTLSKKSGVPLSTLLNIINGNSKNPTLYTIIKICSGFNITLAEFFMDK